jgi:hypothetical protein
MTENIKPRPLSIGFSILLIVLVIIGTAILIPNFVRERATPAIGTCIANLKQIDGAKEFWALEHRMTSGAPCFMTNLVPAYIKFTLYCPLGNKPYEVNKIGDNPVCPNYDPKMKDADFHRLIGPFER